MGQRAIIRRGETRKTIARGRMKLRSLRINTQSARSAGKRMNGLFVASPNPQITATIHARLGWAPHDGHRRRPRIQRQEMGASVAARWAWAKKGGVSSSVAVVTVATARPLDDMTSAKT